MSLATFFLLPEYEPGHVFGFCLNLGRIFHGLDIDCLAKVYIIMYNRRKLLQHKESHLFVFIFVRR